MQLKTPDNKNYYGTHSLRGGGALSMSLAGIPLEIIKKFGRWESDSIHIYVLDAPILKMAENLAKNLTDMITNSYDNFELQKQTSFKRIPIINDIIRVWYALPLESMPDNEEDDYPIASGIWLEGKVVAVTPTNFTLFFEENNNANNDWPEKIIFPTFGGYSWYKLNSSGEIDN